MSSSRTVAWTVWVVASVFYAYQYILRVMPNVMLDDIMQQFQIGAATFGQFSGVYYIGYSLMHLPLGIMLDRFGPRKIMTISILMTVVGMLPLIFSEHWTYPIMGRALIGMGSSAAILGLFKIIRMSFSEAKFPRMLSFSCTIGLIGAIYGGGPLSYMHMELGYQPVVEIFAIMGVLLALITYWIVPDVDSVHCTSVLSDVKEVFSNARVILMCIFAGLMVGPLEGFADVWGSAFLKQFYGFEGAVAAGLPSMIFIGMCFGAPVLSLIAERIGSYIVAIIAAGAIMTGVFSIVLCWELSSMVLSGCFVMVGVCCAYQILAITQASKCVPEHVAGLTTAVANMIIMIFGYAFHSTMGWVINSMGGAANPQALFYGIMVIPFALTIGTSGFILLYATEKASKGSEEAIPT
jgi:MFS family permease